MTRDNAIIRSGGSGRETLDVIEAGNQGGDDESLNVLGGIDEAPSAANMERIQQREYCHLGGFDAFFELGAPFLYIVGIGNPAVRARGVIRCNEHNWRAGTVVHPSGSVGSDTHLGGGTIICGGAQVSTNVRLGRHVRVNAAAVVDHDTCIGDQSSVNPAPVISGDVEVGERVLVGAGAVVVQQLTVGVGASAGVTRDVTATRTVMGVPAREPREKYL